MTKGTSVCRYDKYTLYSTVGSLSEGSGVCSEKLGKVGGVTSPKCDRMGGSVTVNHLMSPGRGDRREA